MQITFSNRLFLPPKSNPVLPQKPKPISQSPHFSKATAHPLPEATDASFIRDVVDASWKSPVLVLFHASWCPPCQSFMRRAEPLAKQYQGKAQFVKVLVSDSHGDGMPFPVNDRRFREWGGVTFPSIMIFANGKPQSVFRYYDRDQTGQPVRNKLVPGQVMGSPSKLSDHAIKSLLDQAGGRMKR